MSEMVGTKSRNIAYLKGKVPSWVCIPTSVALPFGTFGKVLSDELNQLQILKEKLAAGDFDVVEEICKTVLELMPYCTTPAGNVHIFFILLVYKEWVTTHAQQQVQNVNKTKQIVRVKVV
ncbi:putative alpha-glucan, water dikinase [Helianthus anomalus]